MEQLTLIKVRAMDAMCGDQVSAVIRHCRFATILHEDNKELFSAIAGKMGIPVPEFSSYVWLQAYIKEISESYDDLPAIDVVAQHFGIDFSEFSRYCDRRAKTMRDDVMNEEEYQAYLEDLQQDAGMQGD